MYAYAETKPNQHKPDIPVKDGVSDHIMDALRYWCIGMFWQWAKGQNPPKARKAERHFRGARKRLSQGPKRGFRRTA